MLPICVTAVQQYVHLQVSLVFLKYTVVTLSKIFDFYMVVNKIEFDINVINNEVVMMLLSTRLFLASLILILLYPGKQTKQRIVSVHRFCSPVWCFARALLVYPLLAPSLPLHAFHSQSNIERVALTRLR